LDSRPRMTTRPRSKRRAANRKSQGLCRTNRREWGRGSRRMLRDRRYREVFIGKYYRYFFQSPASRVCSVPSLPRSPWRAWLYLRHPAFVAGLQLGGRLQKGTDVGRVLPVGEAGVGEAAVRRTSASVRSRRARGRWRLRQSESSARCSTPGGPQR
jgi:hypothetical protein